MIYNSLKSVDGEVHGFSLTIVYEFKYIFVFLLLLLFLKTVLLLLQVFFSSHTQLKHIFTHSHITQIVTRHGHI